MPSKLQKRSSAARAATFIGGVPVTRTVQLSKETASSYVKGALKKLIRRHPEHRAFSMDSISTMAQLPRGQACPIQTADRISGIKINHDKWQIIDRVRNSVGSASGVQIVPRYPERYEEPECPDFEDTASAQGQNSIVQSTVKTSSTGGHRLRTRSLSRLGRVKENDSTLDLPYNSLDAVLCGVRTW